MPAGKRGGTLKYVRVCLRAYLWGPARSDGQALCMAVTGREAGCHFTCGLGQGNIVRNTMNGRDTKK